MSSNLPTAPEFGTPVAAGRSDEVLRFLALRRSNSAATLMAPAPDPAQLSDLLRLAARVPDHGKLAPWRFIVLDGEGKAMFAARLEALCRERSDALAAAKLAKLKVPPLAVVVVSSPKATAIPAWEQTLSSGAVCLTLLQAASAMGFGANWITDWYSYDVQASAILGLSPDERVAGFVMIGTARDAPLERERPSLEGLITRWHG